MSPAEMEMRNKQQQEWLNSTGKQSQQMVGGGMFTAGIASGLASGLAYNKGGSSLKDDDIKEESRHTVNQAAPAE